MLHLQDIENIAHLLFDLVSILVMLGAGRAIHLFMKVLRSLHDHKEETGELTAAGIIRLFQEKAGN